MRRGRRRLPQPLADTLALPRGERVLAEATGPDGHTWCVGTEVALLVHDGAWRRLPWEEIERAEWDAEAGVLTVVEVTEWGRPERPARLELVDAAALLDLVRERVTKSVLLRQFHPVEGRRGLTVVARRSPTGRGGVAWSYVLAAGLDPDDPAVAEVASRALAQGRRELDGL